MRYCICVLASLFIIIDEAATSYTSYFYTTEKVPAADIFCKEEVSQIRFENSCIIKCAKQRCFRFRWSKGKCYIIRRGNVASSSQLTFKYNKVCFIRRFTFVTIIHWKAFQKKYVIVKEKKNFADSLAHCRSLGGTLALPQSAEENEQMLHELGKSLRLFFHLWPCSSAEWRCTTCSLPPLMLFALPISACVSELEIVILELQKGMAPQKLTITLVHAITWLKVCGELSNRTTSVAWTSQIGTLASPTMLMVIKIVLWWTNIVRGSGMMVIAQEQDTFLVKYFRGAVCLESHHCWSKFKLLTFPEFCS